MRNQYHHWEEESHGLIPARIHPDHQRNQMGDQTSSNNKLSGSGPQNTAMLQTMHTMPAGVRGGPQSGYGPNSHHDPA